MFRTIDEATMEYLEDFNDSIDDILASPVMADEDTIEIIEPCPGDNVEINGQKYHILSDDDNEEDIEILTAQGLKPVTIDEYEKLLPKKYTWDYDSYNEIFIITEDLKSIDVNILRKTFINDNLKQQYIERIEKEYLEDIEQ